MRNCNQLEVLHVYIVDEKLAPDDFLDIFNEKRQLHTLSICLINEKLCEQLSKLDTYCPNLTYLTINQPLKNLGDFENLKYIRYDANGESSFFDTIKLIENLSIKYVDRLEVFDISSAPNHTHTIEIAKLKCLKAFLCANWSSDMYDSLSQLENLQLFSMQGYSDNSNHSNALISAILHWTNLKYLRLPFDKEIFERLILNLPDVLFRRGFQTDSPFILSMANQNIVAEIEDQVIYRYKSVL